MVKKIVPEVRYAMEVTSEIPLAELDEETAGAVSDYLSLTVDENDMKWVSAGGMGGFQPSLSVHIERKLEDVVPQCDPDTCSMSIDVSTEEPRAEDHTGITLRCARTFPKRGQATSAERNCQQNHAAAREVIADYFTAQVTVVSAAKHDIEDANDRIQAARATIATVLK